MIRLITDTSAASVQAGFLGDPPVWMQTILWLCFLHFVVRAALQYLARTGLVRAWTLCRLHRVPVSLPTLIGVAADGASPMAVAGAYVAARDAGLESVSVTQMAAVVQAEADPTVIIRALIRARGLGVDCCLEDVLAQAIIGDDPVAWVERN